MGTDMARAPKGPPPGAAQAALNVALTGMLLLTVLLAAMRAQGTIGGSWGVVLLPFWLLCGVLFFYSVVWVVMAVQVADDKNRRIDLAAYDSTPHYAYYADDGPGAATLSVPGTPLDVRHRAGASRVLYASVVILLAPALLLSGILLTARLQSGSGSAVGAVAPLIAWLSLVIVSQVLREVWRRGSK